MPKEIQILHIPAEKGYPVSLRMPSKFVTQTVVVDKKGATADLPVFLEFVQGEPATISDIRDFEWLKGLTWRIGKIDVPLFRVGKPVVSAAQTREQALEAQVQYLSAQMNKLLENAGLSTDEEDAPVTAAESL